MKDYRILAGIVLSLFSIVILIHELNEGSTNGYSEIPAKSRTIFKEELPKLDASQNIRVLLKTSDYSSIYHPEVKLSSGKEEQIITPDDPRFQEGPIKVKPTEETTITVQSLKRGYGAPSYEGSMEVHKTDSGLVLINELPFESYIGGVVPGEMPGSYELEALKAQAICARSYAYQKLKSTAYPEFNAHLDDSTSFQVYQNSLGNQRTSQAVEETKGQLLTYGGNVVTAYYFSTSSGKTTSIKAWGTEETEGNGYLRSVVVAKPVAASADKSQVSLDDYEKSLPWYRWSITLSKKQLGEIIHENLKKVEPYQGTEIGNLTDAKVTERGPGEIAQKLELKGTKGTVTVETENKIRRVLGSNQYEITRNDGSTCKGRELLPSAFITITMEGEQVRIEGGGFGHGIGMSQNGANEMAKAGMNCQEILQIFYTGCQIEPLDLLN